MGCLKLTYGSEADIPFFRNYQSQGQEAVKPFLLKNTGSLRKKVRSEKKRFNYYPFGLQHATSWTRSTTLKNNRLYNAGAELNEQTKNYETFYRQFDPAIGRFTAIDIMAGKYTSITPYQYAFNDPISFNDPLGDDPSSSSYVGAHERMMMRANPNRGDGYLATMYNRTSIGSGNNWSNGIQYDDWNPYSGSETYKEGRANGFYDIGGLLFGFDNEGTRRLVDKTNNGDWGFWTNYDGAIDYSTEGRIYYGENNKPVLVEDKLLITMATLFEGAFFTSLSTNDPTISKYEQEGGVALMTNDRNASNIQLGTSNVRHIEVIEDLQDYLPSVSNISNIMKRAKQFVNGLSRSNTLYKDYFQSRTDTFKWYDGSGFKFGDTLFQTRRRYILGPDSTKTSITTGESILWE